MTIIEVLLLRCLQGCCRPTNKLLNDTEKLDILNMVVHPCVTITREDRTMVREFSSRPRTTAQEVQPSTGSMHRDHGIVISLSTTRLRLDFHLSFLLFCILQNVNTMKTKS